MNSTLSKNLWPALMILASVWGFLGYIQPQWHDISQLQAEKKEYEQAISNANEVRILRSSLLATYDSIPPEQWSRLLRLLPNSVDGIKLIMDLNGIMGLHGMKLDGFSLIETAGAQSAVPLAADPAFAANAGQINGGPSDAGAAAAAAAQPANRLEQTELDFRFSSVYPNFMSFLRDLERSLQLFDVVSVSLGGSGTNVNTKSEESNPYSLSVKLRTYYLR